MECGDVFFVAASEKGGSQGCSRAGVCSASEWALIVIEKSRHVNEKSLCCGKNK
jgi:hypothetical protein